MVPIAALLMVTACGGVADAPPKGEADGAWFEEVAAERGIDFRHVSGQREGAYLLPESMVGGGGFFDMDGDGDLDVYLVQSGSLYDPASSPGNRLYENLGDGTFRDVTLGSGADDAGYGMGLACGDYDNDGDVDLYVTNHGPNALLRNEGNGTFTEIGRQAGVADDGFGASSGFVDYDRDGDLDLFVTNYVRWSIDREIDCYNSLGSRDYCSPRNYRSPASDVLYRNDGNGRFTDVTRESGIASSFGNGLGCLFADFDDDGWLDLFVANDAVMDQLWINQRDGTFRDEALLAGCAVDMEGGVPKAGMGVTAADLDGDGDLDVMVCNWAGESDSVFRNDGGSFMDITNRSGLGTISRQFTRFGVGWVDFDNDGQYDLYQANGRVSVQPVTYDADPYAEPNLLFRGLPGPRFEEVLPRGGTASELIATSRGAAFGDFDGDGGMDVLVVNRDAPAHLLRNRAARGRHWIRLRLVESSGRDAEGAVVRVLAGGRSFRRDVSSASSYLTCRDPRVHLGLGETRRVDEVSVRWVDGTVEVFGPFEADGDRILRRGEGRAGP